MCVCVLYVCEFMYVFQYMAEKEGGKDSGRETVSEYTSCSCVTLTEIMNIFHSCGNVTDLLQSNCMDQDFRTVLIFKLNNIFVP